MSRLRPLKLLAGAASIPMLALILPVASQSSAAPLAMKYAYGIDTYVTYNCQGTKFMVSSMRTQAAEFKKLGANMIGISFPLYTTSINSNDVFAEDGCSNGGTDENFQTPPPGILGDVVAAAEDAGLKVLLRPLISDTNLYEKGQSGGWCGVLAPTDVAVWFRNYLTTLRPYLKMAQLENAQSFAIMTELDSLAKYTSTWNEARVLSHALYRGTIVWDYSWYTKAPKATIAGTAFAVDAYPDLPSLSVTATPRQIEAAWDGRLKLPSYSIPVIEKTTIDEVGIPAQDGAYACPSGCGGLPLKTHPFNAAIQTNWFTAACNFMKQHDMEGIFFWGPHLTTDHGRLLSTSDPTSPDNLQPAAQQAIRGCFS